MAMTTNLRSSSVQTLKGILVPGFVRVWTWVQLNPETGFYTDAGKSAVRDALDQVENSKVNVNYFVEGGMMVENVYVGGPHPDPAQRGDKS
jgi:hypothetical protein